MLCSRISELIEQWQRHFGSSSSSRFILSDDTTQLTSLLIIPDFMIVINVYHPVTLFYYIIGIVDLGRLNIMLPLVALKLDYVHVGGVYSSMLVIVSSLSLSLHYLTLTTTNKPREL